MNIFNSLVQQLDGRAFVTTGNEHGLSTAATIFRYNVDGIIVSGEYRGGEILIGRIVGKVTSPSSIELLFQCVAADGSLMCGQSSGQIGRHHDGRLTIDFDWSWLNGDRSGGTSSYIEADA